MFKKSNVLFGIDLAYQAIKSLDAAVIVEGYFDVICMHELGINNVVAALGKYCLLFQPIIIIFL